VSDDPLDAAIPFINWGSHVSDGIILPIVLSIRLPCPTDIRRSRARRSARMVCWAVCRSLACNEVKNNRVKSRSRSSLGKKIPISLSATLTPLAWPKRADGERTYKIAARPGSRSEGYRSRREVEVQPGQEGKPVAAQATVEVNFRLL